MSNDSADHYKTTVFLPRTDFPMRAGLGQKEPEILKQWEEADLHGQIREQGKNREKFILHDGPPYANGHIHIGHAANKILKDVVIKSQTMLGKDCPYVPGWDCHGLPIEWKVEEKYREAGKDKDEVAINDFRAECREFAQHWVDIQVDEFKRLGVFGKWDDPYLTMTYPAEAAITKEIHKFVTNGGLYKGVRPVLWSVVEKTALADAELEYHDHKSITIWVRFPVVKAAFPELEGADLVIWTTTPWTIPGNRAVAYGAEMDYAVFKVIDVDEGATAKPGDLLVVNTDLSEDVRENAKIKGWTQVKTFKGAELDGTVCRHPYATLEGAGDHWGYDIPVLEADFVTTEQGTGLVHIAPGHGADDFELGKKNKLEVPQTVGEDGRFYEHVPVFAGKCVYDENGKPGDANGAAIKALFSVEALLAKGSLRHQYPHSWRSKAPLIFRTTPQWFISMDTNDLREKALGAIGETRFVPERGRARIKAMVESRPDWCISRQRAWGVPIAIFVEKKTGEVLKDPEVLERTVKIFAEEGSDAWYSRAPGDFLGNNYNADDYEQVRDIVDVWFESGSTHAFVMEDRDDLEWPAALYLEGSDQHRGWFQSSLLESCGTRGRAPFETVLTHGFVMDGEGRKMSKSLGNIVKPQVVCDKFGADILRLWSVNSDYTEDVRIGDEIIKSQTDIYRRLRNTLRYLLGNLAGFNEHERVARKDYASMPELERWVLHRLKEMDALVRNCVENYDFNRLFSNLHNFCAIELSAFYFDIRKDCVYCDRPDSDVRRAARTVLAEVFDALTAWLAPVLCFTAEEAWLARPHAREGEAESVHLRSFPDLPEAWLDTHLGEKWEKIRNIRRVVTGAIEVERAEKRLGSSLQARPTVYIDNPGDLDMLAKLDFADIAITSDIELKEGPAPEGVYTIADVHGVGVTVEMAEGEKCCRCWKILPEVGGNADHPELCDRCADAVDHIAQAAE